MAVGSSRALTGWAARASVVGGFALSLLFLWLALRNVDFGDMWRALRAVDWWVLPPSLAVLAGGVWLRVLRWRALFAPGSKPSLPAATRALLAGLMLNLVLPLRAGEAARIIILSRETGISRSEVLATAVVERVLDVGALLALLLVSTPFLPHVSWLRTASVVAAVLVVGIVAAIVVLRRHDERPIRFFLRLLPLVSDEQADRVAANLVRGLASVRSARMALHVLALTFASWLVIAGSTTIALLGFHDRLGFGAGLLVVVATNLALVLPSSPAGIGPYEAGVVVALGVYGVGSSGALSAALLLHAINFAPFVLTGLLALWASRGRVATRAVQHGDSGSPR